MRTIYKLISMLCIACCFAGCKDSDDEIAQASLTLSVPTVSFTAKQSSEIVKVDATRKWSAIASDYWITVTPDNYPSAKEHFIANVSVSVSFNDTGDDREGFVVFYLEDEEVVRLIVKQSTEGAGEGPDEEFPITWANLQWCASTAILEGGNFEAGSCVFANGITNVLESTTGEDITCDIGYSLDDTSPDGDGWTWTPCWFNGDWGDNFYYQGRIEGIPVGNYHYTFRYRNGTGPYKYAGTNGLWNGVDNLSGTFEVKSASGGGDIDYSKFTITWANLQWKAADEIQAGSFFEAGSQVYIDGLTNQDSPSASGEGVIGEIGYSTSPDPTGNDWVWNEGWFNGDWGNNFYYQATTPEITVPGTYYYTFRFKMGKDGQYAYAGTDGLWDGAGNVCGTFIVK